MFSCRILEKAKLSYWRFLQSGMPGRNFSKEYKEVEIDVPWGKIAGKYWGSTDIQPIIAVHGWQSNSASFDPLMNYLPENLSVLAIDLPGHGYSSWIPKGIPYSFQIYMQAIERVRQHYKLEKIGIIGFSMGGMLGFNYAAWFPEKLKFMAALDYYKLPSYDDSLFAKMIKGQWEKFFQLEQKTGDTPRYEESDAMKKFMQADLSINETACKILFTRGVKRYPNGTVSFRRDPKVAFLAMSDFCSTHDFHKILATRMKFPYMIVKAENSDYVQSKELFFDVLKVIETHSTDFKFHYVPGTHNVPMDSPEVVANVLNPFILKYF